MATKKNSKKSIKKTTEASIRPLGDRVLVKAITQEEAGSTTASGILLPDTIDKERPEEGMVIAVGEGKPCKHNDTCKNEACGIVNVKKGDRVIFTKFGPEEVTVDGEEYLIVSESNILAVVE